MQERSRANGIQANPIATSLTETPSPSSENISIMVDPYSKTHISRYEENDRKDISKRPTNAGTTNVKTINNGEINHIKERMNRIAK